MKTHQRSSSYLPPLRAMLKQILSRLPRKSFKSDSPESSPRSNSESAHESTGVCIRSNAAKPSAVFPSTVVADIEPRLPFKDAPPSEQMNLFISKLNICSMLFDFDDPTKSTVEKDLKRQTLIDLTDFVSSANSRFPEPAILAMCRTSAINLFRVFPPNMKSSSSNENDDDEPVFDPAWSHLHIVYDLLLKFVTSSNLDQKVAKRYIDQSFISRLLDLFESEDPRERECLKTLVHRIYGKFMVHRPFIRKSISNIFYKFVLEADRHNGIAELLEIFGSVISGFASPLKEEHKNFFSRALIPLHKPKSLGMYFQQLSYCVMQFIDKDPSLASKAVRGLLKLWPITSSQKEVMFLVELEEILEVIDMVDFQKVMVPLFWRVGCCINSYHFQVAERALFLWNNDRIVHLFVQNRQVILPIIFPALEKNSRNHWNNAVLNLTLNVRKLLSDIDDALLASCHARFFNDQANLNSIDEKRKGVWERLEAEANRKPIARNTAVLIV